jgi:hypothetical protein
LQSCSWKDLRSTGSPLLLPLKDRTGSPGLIGR